jgi:hypothetical protein
MTHVVQHVAAGCSECSPCRGSCPGAVGPHSSAAAAAAAAGTGVFCCCRAMLNRWRVLVAQQWCLCCHALPHPLTHKPRDLFDHS